MLRDRGAVGIVAVLALMGALVAAPAAAAAPDCDVKPRLRVIVSGFDTLESLIVDRKGRLYFTDADRGQLLFMRNRRAEPRVVLDGIRAPGGLAFLPDGSLLVGYGDAIVTAATGFLNPQAGLIRYDPKTGKSSVWTDGLTMANGVARAPDGTVYASNDVGFGIDRVKDGVVERAWAPVFSSNGLVVDRSRRWLYAAQTFQPAAIARIELTDPPRVETWFRAPLGDIAAGPDGITRDREGNIYVAANGAGQVWRIDADDRKHCSLANRAPFGPSDVAFGRGRKRFKRANLYATTFQGEVLELALRAVRG